MKKFKQIRESVNEISKGMVGRYLKKVPASAADAGRKSSGAMGIGPEDQKKNMKKGISQFVNRQRGTSTAVDKMTGKAKVPATEANIKEYHHDDAAKARAKMAVKKTAEIKKRHADEIKKGIRLPDYSKKQKEDSDAVKAFLAKGGKIKKLPPGKAQGYHGKDDPGKGMHGMMDKPDTKGFKKSKFVRSMK